MQSGSAVWSTGTSGFIGRHLIRFLQPQVTVVQLTTNHVSASEADGRIFLDLEDHDCVRRLTDKLGPPQSFIHLGWAGMTEPNAEIHIDKNVAIGRALIERMYEAGLSRFIFVGSVDEYGDNRGLLREDMPPLGELTRYAEAKRVVCSYGLEQAERFGRVFIHVRLTNTYGPGQRPQSLVNKLFAHRLGTVPVALGPCDNFRDYIYVGEAAEGIGRLCKVGGSDIVNLGSGRAVLLRDFVMTFWRHLGADPERIKFGALGRRKEEPSQLEAWVDLRRLEAITGWKPALSLDQGMQRTIDELDRHWRTGSATGGS